MYTNYAKYRKHTSVSVELINGKESQHTSNEFNWKNPVTVTGAYSFTAPPPKPVNKSVEYDGRMIDIWQINGKTDTTDAGIYHGTDEHGFIAFNTDFYRREDNLLHFQALEACMMEALTVTVNSHNHIKLIEKQTQSVVIPLVILQIIVDYALIVQFPKTYIHENAVNRVSSRYPPMIRKSNGAQKQIINGVIDAYNFDPFLLSIYSTNKYCRLRCEMHAIMVFEPGAYYKSTDIAYETQTSRTGQLGTVFRHTCFLFAPNSYINGEFCIAVENPKYQKQMKKTQTFCIASNPKKWQWIAFPKGTYYEWKPIGHARQNQDCRNFVFYFHFKF